MIIKKYKALTEKEAILLAKEDNSSLWVRISIRRNR